MHRGFPRRHVKSWLSFYQLCNSSRKGRFLHYVKMFFIFSPHKPVLVFPLGFTGPFLSIGGRVVCQWSVFYTQHKTSSISTVAEKSEAPLDLQINLQEITCELTVPLLVCLHYSLMGVRSGWTERGNKVNQK